MYIDPTRYTTRPTDDRIPQELAIYDRLEQLSIPGLPPSNRPPGSRR